jgi:thioredoxin-related protein
MKHKKTNKKNATSEAVLQKISRISVKRKRRLFIKSAVSLGVFGVAAAAISVYDAQKKELHDLSIIGAGKSVVVQIHDTSCPICRRLKSRTVNVLEGQSQIEYRIADVVTSKGRALQEKYGVQKTTLLLFDAEGGHVDTVFGLQTVEQLESLFARNFPPQA